MIMLMKCTCRLFSSFAIPTVDLSVGCNSHLHLLLVVPMVLELGQQLKGLVSFVDSIQYSREPLLCHRCFGVIEELILTCCFFMSLCLPNVKYPTYGTISTCSAIVLVTSFSESFFFLDFLVLVLLRPLRKIAETLLSAHNYSV